MTDVSRIADSTAFKLVVPIMQTLICAGALGAFTYVNTTLTSLQVQLSAYQTNQALVIQRVDSLERRQDANEKLTDAIRSTTAESRFQINSLSESFKTLVLTGRPK